MNMQKHLLYITNLYVKDVSSKIRAVKADWNDLENTVSIAIYFDGQASEEELEDFQEATTEIIAHCSNALLEENFIRLDYPKPLPENPHWAYKRNEEKIA